MKLLAYILLLVFWLTVGGGSVPGQTAGSRADDSRVRALLDEVQLQADRAGQPLRVVRLKSKAAGLLWLLDAESGRLRFTQLWTWVNSLQEKGFNREIARAEVLRQLYRRDAALAGRWQREVLAEERSAELSPQERLSGRSPDARLLTSMATSLLEEDRPLAVNLLRQSFDLGYTYPAHATLNRLIALDPAAGYALSSRVLADLKSQPVTVALAAAQLFFNDYYPLRGSPIQAAGVVIDEGMRRQYYNQALGILRRSLQDPTLTGLTPSEQKQPASHQAMLALQLSAMTPKYNPLQTDEMRQLADRLSGALPPEFPGLRRAMESRVHEASPPSGSPDQLLSTALVRGDYTTATSLVSQVANDSLRPMLSQIVTQSGVRSLVARGELAEAMPVVLGIGDSAHRLQLLADLAQAAARRNEPRFARYIISIVVDQSAQWPCSVNKVNTLLPLTHLGGSRELLDQTLNCINSLPGSEDQIMSNIAFQKTFQSMAVVSREQALEAAGALTSPGLELMARLAACEGLLQLSK